MYPIKFEISAETDVLPQMPKKLTILSERYEGLAPEMKKVMEDFIQDFEKATQLQRKTTTMDELWKSHAPKDSSEKTFAETFQTVSRL